MLPVTSFKSAKGLRSKGGQREWSFHLSERKTRNRLAIKLNQISKKTSRGPSKEDPTTGNRIQPGSSLMKLLLQPGAVCQPPYGVGRKTCVRCPTRAGVAAIRGRLSSWSASASASDGEEAHEGGASPLAQVLAFQSDMTLRFAWDGSSVPTKRHMLSLASPVLRSMLEKGGKEAGVEVEVSGGGGGGGQGLHCSPACFRVEVFY